VGRQVFAANSETIHLCPSLRGSLEISAGDGVVVNSEILHDHREEGLRLKFVIAGSPSGQAMKERVR
jgi:hypothetical protein